MPWPMRAAELGGEFTPLLGSALQFAFEKATTEGKITIGALVIMSLFSWTVIIGKARQLWIARVQTKKFFASFRSKRNPLDLLHAKEKYPGSPAFEVYETGAEELQHYLTHNSVNVKGQPKIKEADYDAIVVAMEREVGAQSISLEKGMIILSTAVAGGPFVGLLGTVWGVMETFSGIAKASSATLSAMAPGVAGALIATVVGLFVAIPAMFAYNYMVTMVRDMTVELDSFASEYVTSIENKCVDKRSPLADELRDIFKEYGLAESRPGPVYS